MTLTDAFGDALPVKAEELGPVDEVLEKGGSALTSLEGCAVADGSAKVGGGVDVLVVNDELVEEAVIAR